MQRLFTDEFDGFRFKEDEMVEKKQKLIKEVYPLLRGRTAKRGSLNVWNYFPEEITPALAAHIQQQLQLPISISSEGGSSESSA